MMKHGILMVIQKLNYIRKMVNISKNFRELKKELQFFWKVCLT